jgi:hypothetical protein
LTLLLSGFDYDLSLRSAGTRQGDMKRALLGMADREGRVVLDLRSTNILTISVRASGDQVIGWSNSATASIRSQLSIGANEPRLRTVAKGRRFPQNAPQQNRPRIVAAAGGNHRRARTAQEVALNASYARPIEFA